MIGALSNHLDIPEDTWREAITALVKPRFLELNLKAFDAGRAASQWGRIANPPQQKR